MILAEKDKQIAAHQASRLGLEDELRAAQEHMQTRAGRRSESSNLSFADFMAVETMQLKHQIEYAEAEIKLKSSNLVAAQADCGAKLEETIILNTRLQDLSAAQGT